MVVSDNQQVISNLGDGRKCHAWNSVALFIFVIPVAQDFVYVIVCGDLGTEM